MKFSYSKVEELCNQLKSINVDMQKRLDEIKNQISTVNSNWTGIAAEFYLEKSKRLTDKFAEFFNELNACTLYMQKCSDNYETLEKQIQQQINDELKNSKIFN